MTIPILKQAVPLLAGQEMEFFVHLHDFWVFIIKSIARSQLHGYIIEHGSDDTGYMFFFYDGHLKEVLTFQKSD